jgi:alpha-ribazole phosphatase
VDGVSTHASAADVIHVWRHPQPLAAAGRCIGRTDVAVDPRKARRLARRIDRFARRHALVRVVATSPLARCASVGRALRRRGWTHVVDAPLLELDFGAWEGRPWSDIPRAEIDAWVADFAAYRPGGGESLRELLDRAAAWTGERVGVVVGHAGWINARRWLEEHAARVPRACEWPKSLGYGGGPIGLAAGAESTASNMRDTRGAA